MVLNRSRNLQPSPDRVRVRVGVRVRACRPDSSGGQFTDTTLNGVRPLLSYLMPGFHPHVTSVP